MTDDESIIGIWYNAKHQLHREYDLPAIEYADGSRYWYQNGRQHRGGDLPAVEIANICLMWYVTGACQQ